MTGRAGRRCLGEWWSNDDGDGRWTQSWRRRRNHWQQQYDGWYNWTGRYNWCQQYCWRRWRWFVVRHRSAGCVGGGDIAGTTSGAGAQRLWADIVDGATGDRTLDIHLQFQSAVVNERREKTRRGQRGRINMTLFCGFSSSVSSYLSGFSLFQRTQCILL